MTKTDNDVVVEALNRTAHRVECVVRTYPPAIIECKCGIEEAKRITRQQAKAIKSFEEAIIYAYRIGRGTADRSDIVPLALWTMMRGTFPEIYEAIDEAKRHD